MRIIIITQDDPFYLPANLDFLLSNLPREAQIVGCIITKVSPFGKQESFLSKARRTYSIFGFRFFVRYGLEYLVSKLPHRPGVSEILTKHSVKEIPITSSINSSNSLDLIRSFLPDLLISIAGNEIFRKPLIDLAPHGCLNLHTALLPIYRGLMPSFWVLKNHEPETGVSVFYVDEGIDSGPILVQERFPIGQMSQRDLIKHSKAIGMRAIIEATEKILVGNTKTLPNRDEDASYYSFPTKQDVKEFRRTGGRFY